MKVSPIDMDTQYPRLIAIYAQNHRKSFTDTTPREVLRQSGAYPTAIHLVLEGGKAAVPVWKPKNGLLTFKS